MMQAKFSVRISAQRRMGAVLAGVIVFSSLCAPAPAHAQRGATPTPRPAAVDATARCVSDTGPLIPATPGKVNYRTEPRASGALVNAPFAGEPVVRATKIVTGGQWIGVETQDGATSAFQNIGALGASGENAVAALNGETMERVFLPDGKTSIPCVPETLIPAEFGPVAYTYDEVSGQVIAQVDLTRANPNQPPFAVLKWDGKAWQSAPTGGVVETETSSLMKVSIEMPADLGYSFELKEGAEKILSELVYDMIAANMNTMAKHGIVMDSNPVYTPDTAMKILEAGGSVNVFELRAMTQDELQSPYLISPPVVAELKQLTGVPNIVLSFSPMQGDLGQEALRNGLVFDGAKTYSIENKLGFKMEIDEEQGTIYLIIDTNVLKYASLGKVPITDVDRKKSTARVCFTLGHLIALQLFFPDALLDGSIPLPDGGEILLQKKGIYDPKLLRIKEQTGPVNQALHTWFNRLWSGDGIDTANPDELRAAWEFYHSYERLLDFDSRECMIIKIQQ